MHYFVTEMCTHVHIAVTKWCDVRYGTGALWDLCNRSIQMIQCFNFLSGIRKMLIRNDFKQNLWTFQLRLIPFGVALPWYHIYEQVIYCWNEWIHLVCYSSRMRNPQFYVSGKRPMTGSACEMGSISKSGRWKRARLYIQNSNLLI